LSSLQSGELKDEPSLRRGMSMSRSLLTVFARISLPVSSLAGRVLRGRQGAGDSRPARSPGGHHGPGRAAGSARGDIRVLRAAPDATAGPALGRHWAAARAAPALAL